MSCLKLAGDGYAVSGAIEIVANGEGELRCDLVEQNNFLGRSPRACGFRFEMGKISFLKWSCFRGFICAQANYGLFGGCG